MKSNNKKLSDLRLIELRTELEKRGLEKTGLKSILIERLQKAIIQEGQDPEKYEFNSSNKESNILSPSEDSSDNNEKQDQLMNDSSVLMIETPTLEIIDLDATQKIENNPETDGEINQEEISKNVTNCSEEHEETSINNEEVELAFDLTEDNNDDALKLEKSSKNDHESENDKEGNCDNIKLDNALSVEEDCLLVTSSPKKEGDNSKNIGEEKSAKSKLGRTLWITNLLPTTRAQELKHLLSPFGKVVGAKVVQSSSGSHQNCYGYVTMGTRASADICVKELNNKDLKGNIIKVLKVKPISGFPVKAKKQLNFKDEEKKLGSNKKTPKKDKVKLAEKKVEDTKKKIEETKTNNSKDNRKSPKSLPQRREQRRETVNEIRERERRRAREFERERREEVRRRRELQRFREIEKKQREESLRLAREREKIRNEREFLERQRAEILKLERDRQRLEREKLEQEKLELRRQMLQLEENRRPVKRPSPASNYDKEDRRKAHANRLYRENPPPPIYEVSSKIVSTNKKPPNDYKSRNEAQKRDSKLAHSSPERYSSKYHFASKNPKPIRLELASNVSSPRISKEARYRSRSPVPYRPVRDDFERMSVTDHHANFKFGSSRDMRLVDSSRKEEIQYIGNESWGSRSSVPTDTWRRVEIESNGRWMKTGGPSASYSNSGSEMPGIEPATNSSGSLNRMDPYKNMSSWRKF